MGRMLPLGKSTISRVVISCLYFHTKPRSYAHLSHLKTHVQKKNAFQVLKEVLSLCLNEI